MPHFLDHGKDGSPSTSEAPDEAAIARSARIATKNRRMRYLEMHPEYFTAPSLELADPLLYDRMVRRFQSAEERERDGRAKGYSGVLEADLVRSEAKLDAIQHPDPHSPITYTRMADGSISGVEKDGDERAMGREDGWEKWRDAMARRFVRGGDEEFDYRAVDESEEFDDRGEEERRGLEEYLLEEEERFVGEGTPVGETGVLDY